MVLGEVLNIGKLSGTSSHRHAFASSTLPLSIWLLRCAHLMPPGVRPALSFITVPTVRSCSAHELFVIELVRKVFLPHDGPREVLPESPVTEYFTSVHTSIICPPERDADADAERPVDASEDLKDKTTNTAASPPPLTLSPLYPPSRPTSMGLSFLATPKHKPALEVCATQARQPVMADGQLNREIPAPAWVPLGWTGMKRFVFAGMGRSLRPGMGRDLT